MSAATAAAALQQAPVAFRCSSPRITSVKPANMSFSGGLRLPKLTIKLSRKSRRGGGASGARMADSPAQSYAIALADVANKNGTLEATLNDVEQVQKMFEDEYVYSSFTSPVLTVDQKRELIDAISGSLQKHVVNFLKVLVESNRIDLIREILKEFELVYNRLTDTEMALVTSVVKLESDILAQIAKEVQKRTGAKNVRIKTAIDENLVAGFTILYGGAGSKLIDLSVKRQLEDIAAQLEGSEMPLAV